MAGPNYRPPGEIFESDDEEDDEDYESKAPIGFALSMSVAGCGFLQVDYDDGSRKRSTLSRNPGPLDYPPNDTAKLYVRSQLRALKLQKQLVKMREKLQKKSEQMMGLRVKVLQREALINDLRSKARDEACVSEEPEA